MRDLLKLFNRRYSAVNATDNINPNPSAEENLQHLQQLGFEQRNRKKSLQATMPLKRGITIVDSFFNQRRDGKRYPKCAFLLLAAGLCAIGSAIAMYIIQPYEAIFKWKLILSEGGEIFNLWQDPPVNVYIKIYLWNITNSEEFLNGNEKMRVEEVGPYVYRELLSHENVRFNDNGTVSTEPRHPLVWDEEKSVGRSENDTLMLPNIALLSIAQVASEKNYFLRLPINMVIRNTNSQPIVKMTAREFMFGFESPLTTLGNQFLPDWIYFDKVGLIDRMYDFVGDYETFFTGETDPTMSGLYDTFLGSKNLKQWDEEHCSNIHGASDGTKFKSFINPDEQLLFFRKSMCRPQRMVRVGNATIKSELQAYRYHFEDNAMDNGFVDERNKCFCRNGNCLPSGLLDISECYYGFPIALSYPHFLDTDEKVASQIEGLTPNRTDHETYFYVQPMSGLPLEISVKFQINMAMRDVSSMAHVEQFSNIVIPMVWFEITLEKLPEELKNRFILYINILPVVLQVSEWALFVGGIMSLLYAITRVSMQLSSGLQNSHKISKQRKYSNVYPDTIQRLGDSDKVYELNEKRRKNSAVPNDVLYDIDITSEKRFMLDEEPALSEDESSDDSESKSSDDFISIKHSENGSLNTNTTDTTLPMEWQLGAASSCLNDIGNDDFPQILRIEEGSDDEDDHMPRTVPIIRLNSQSPELKTAASSNRISDSANDAANEMKPSASDISISHILDQEDISTEIFDENTFANVNTNALSAPVLKPSSSESSIAYYFDRV